MSKGTIVYVGGFELPDKNAAAHRVINNAKAIRELGYKVIFISENRALDYDRKQILFGFDCWEIAVKASKIETLKTLINVKKTINVIGYYDNVKFIIGYNYPSIRMLKLKKYCKKNRIKLIGDITEWYGTKDKNLLYKFFKVTDTTLRMRFINNSLDGLILISNFLKKKYNSENIVCIPPLVDLKDKKWDKIKSINNKDIKLVYAGSPSREKERLDIVFNAVNVLSKTYPIQLDIIGINEKQFKTMYKVNTKDSNFYNRDAIKFYGKIDHTKALNAIKEADYTVIARENTRLTKAGFPTKFSESISCDTPVITTDNSDLSSYIDNKINGFIIDIDNFENEIKNILLNKDKPEVIKDTFDYNKYKKDINCFFTNVLRK